MVPITSGRCVILMSTMTSANPTYPSAMTGTMMLLTLAMRWIPPKIINRVSPVRMMPIGTWLMPNACSTAAQMVLLCTELKANPKVTVISMANRIPIHGFFNPFFM